VLLSPDQFFMWGFHEEIHAVCSGVGQAKQWKKCPGRSPNTRNLLKSDLCRNFIFDMDFNIVMLMSPL
jgi:hypothetical protein